MDEKIAMLESEVRSLQSQVFSLSAQVADLSSELSMERTGRQAADTFSESRISNLELLINDLRVE